MQVRRLDNNQIIWLCPNGGFDEESFNSKALLGLLPGPVHITVFVSGIPSVSARTVVGASEIYLPVVIR